MHNQLYLLALGPAAPSSQLSLPEVLDSEKEKEKNRDGYF